MGSEISLDVKVQSMEKGTGGRERNRWQRKVLATLLQHAEANPSVALLTLPQRSRVWGPPLTFYSQT